VTCPSKSSGMVAIPEFYKKLRASARRFEVEDLASVCGYYPRTPCPTGVGSGPIPCIALSSHDWTGLDICPVPPADIEG
jgi:hypothetical protein